VWLELFYSYLNIVLEIRQNRTHLSSGGVAVENCGLPDRSLKVYKKLALLLDMILCAVPQVGPSGWAWQINVTTLLAPFTRSEIRRHQDILTEHEGTVLLSSHFVIWEVQK